MPTPNDPNALEDLIAGLPTREPSRILDERIAATLHAAANENGPLGHVRRRAAIWATAAAVLLATSVTVVVLIVLSHAHPDIGPMAERAHEVPAQGSPVPDRSGDVSSPAIQPVSLVWSRDASDQLRYTPSGKPYRAVVRQTVDQRVWQDPETGAILQRTTPREELFIMQQPVY